MPFTLAQPIRPSTAHYSVFKDSFTPEECDAIIALSKNLERREALVAGGPDVGVASERRRSDIWWIEWEPAYNWLFERIAAAVVGANAQWWGFHLGAMNEALQLTHYKEDNLGHYDWHEDHGIDGAFQLRKLSVVVMLTDTHEGGQFEFTHLGPIPETTRGTIIIFPSFKTHRVTPVTKGERWSLVTWISGPAFV
jgi:PKHD-type hydroxylase